MLLIAHVKADYVRESRIEMLLNTTEGGSP